MLNSKKHKNLLSHLKMSKNILTFGNIEIERKKFYHNNTLIFFKGCSFCESISI